MPRRRRIPTVGTKGLHTVQLSPEARKIASRRAKGAARREYAPVVQADRQAIGAVNRGYQTEARSIRGASSSVQNSLSQALRGLKRSGLSGGYLRQAQKELVSRQGDAAASIPFLLADARQQRAEGLTDARQQLIQDIASQKQSAASKFNSLLESQRSKGSTVLKEREEDRESEGGGKELQRAKEALKDSLTAWKKSPALREENPLSSTSDWLKLAKGLHTEFGLDQDSVNRAIEELRARIKKNANVQVKGLVFNTNPDAAINQPPEG